MTVQLLNFHFGKRYQICGMPVVDANLSSHTEQVPTASSGIRCHKIHLLIYKEKFLKAWFQFAPHSHCDHSEPWPWSLHIQPESGNQWLLSCLKRVWVRLFCLNIIVTTEKNLYISIDVILICGVRCLSGKLRVMWNHRGEGHEHSFSLQHTPWYARVKAQSVCLSCPGVLTIFQMPQKLLLLNINVPRATQAFVRRAQKP